MSFWNLAPKPAGPLGFHRVLAPSAGVKVSPLCLGAMNFGTAWNDFMGECTKETAFTIMDTFYKNGGNFIDTANNYQAEQSEEWVGEWMRMRQNRDQMVIATKYTTGFRTTSFDKEPIQSNFVGNSLKSMHISVNRSLQKLGTDYIDILYLHWWDFTTSVEEVMHGLNVLINTGKVLYLGVSDTPAWVVVKANDYARANGLRQFSIYQGKWNAGFRDMEREIVPMCRDQGMAVAPWAPLGQGRFKTAETRQEGHSESQRAANMSEAEIRISEALESIANRKDVSLHGVVSFLLIIGSSETSEATDALEPLKALAYLLNKAPYVFPIVGQRKIEHLNDNIKALSIDLSKEDMDEIDNAVPFDPGFPLNFIFRSKYDLTLGASDVLLTKLSAYIDSPGHQQPIAPRK